MVAMYNNNLTLRVDSGCDNLLTTLREKKFSEKKKSLLVMSGITQTEPQDLTVSNPCILYL